MGKAHRATGNPLGRPSRLPLDFNQQILNALKRRIDPKTGLARPDWKGIARELHVSRSTIGRRMPDLRDCGLVESVLIPVGPKVKITLYRLHE